MRTFFFILILILVPLSSQAARPMTLMEAYESALSNSERVAISQEKIMQARARYQQALGAVLPRVGGIFTENLQDRAPAAGGGGVGSTLTRSSRPESRIVLTQPLFHGLQEIYGLKLGRADTQRQAFLKKDTERLLFSDVAQAFFTVAQIERDLQTVRGILSINQAEVAEVKRRVDIGKSRESESFLQSSSVSLLLAEVERLKGLRDVGYEALAFLTGLDPQPPIAWRSPVQENLMPVDAYVDSAMSRPDVLASSKFVDVNRGQLGYERGKLLPQGDVEAGYYLYRVGFQQDIKWDAIFRVTVPIFNWTNIGDIREAKSLLREARYLYQETKERVGSEVKQAYDSYLATRRQVRELQKSTGLLAKSYELERADFHVGLVNNLDLLQIQRSLLDARRSLNQAEVQSWVDWINLQIAAGKLP